MVSVGEMEVIAQRLLSPELGEHSRSVPVRTLRI